MSETTSDNAAPGRADGDAKVAVTGATGRIGGRVARRLADAGVAQRLVVRDPSRAPRLPGASIAAASYADAGAARAALTGIDTLFMVSGSESANRLEEHKSFVDAARAAGVRHLVYLSFFGASPTATFTLVRDHWATEQYVRERGMTFTFLRDNLYADFLPLMVGEDDTIRGPAGDGRAAVVVQDDVADAAVAVLRSPRAHAGAVYDLTGPQALTFGEMADAISSATGRKVTYHPETVEEAYASRAGYGAPDWLVRAWVTTYTAVAAGELDAVSNAVEQLTGHPATPLATLLHATGSR